MKSILRAWKDTWAYLMDRPDKLKLLKTKQPNGLKEALILQSLVRDLQDKIEGLGLLLGKDIKLDSNDLILQLRQIEGLVPYIENLEKAMVQSNYLTYLNR